MDQNVLSGSRRKFLSVSAIGIGVGLLSKGLFGATHVKTPPETEGPFFPVEDQEDKDVDLTKVRGRNGAARGVQVIVNGTLKDAEGKPVEGAWIYIWQACFTGRYNHPRDKNPAKLDPNFQYWAKFSTDKDGKFSFKTVKPGAYPASDGWTRPPHIHFRVESFNHPQLTTQMYFADEAELNNADYILRKTGEDYGREARESLIVDFSQTNPEGVKVGRFDITLGETPNLA